jgi:hypothetical protein
MFWGVDLDVDQGDCATLAVTFVYHTQDGYRRVGDDPDQAPPATVHVDGQPLEGLWYRMKLLKAPADESGPLDHALAIRQIYPLGFIQLDPQNFRMRIERLDVRTDTPERDENGVPYLQIFGLDEGDFHGLGERDELPDVARAELFDLAKGLLVFPESFARPFAADRADYELHAAGTAFAWSDTSYLATHLAPELYDRGTSTVHLPRHGHFRFVCEREIYRGD